MKFITQRQINLNFTNKNRNRSLPHYNNYQSQGHTQNSELTDHYLSSLEEARITSLQEIQLQKRLIVLQSHEKKRLERSVKNGLINERHNEIKHAIMKEREEKEQYANRLKEEARFNKEMLEFQREKRMKSLKKAKEDLHLQKIKKYQETRQQKKYNSLQKQKLQTQQSLLKQKNKYKVKLSEIEQKLKLKQFYNNKRQRILYQNMMEKERMERMAYGNAKRIQKLQEIQSVMLTKYANSRMVSIDNDNFQVKLPFFSKKIRKQKDNTNGILSDIFIL